MDPLHNLIVDGSRLDFEHLSRLQLRPPLFEPGAPHFWDDPHIAEQLLAKQLNAQADAASRRLHIVDREVAWTIVALGLEDDDDLLDLGCGPGFYAARLARRGLRVTGIDYAPQPIEHARDMAKREQLPVTYLCQDYLELDMIAAFDAATMINSDFSALNPSQRQDLLARIHRALKPGGSLALDVLTPRFASSHRLSNQWYVADGGLWRSGAHLVLETGFDYPKDDVFLNQYIIIEPNGTTTVYRNWFQTFTSQSIGEELAAGGFNVTYIGGNLRGDALTAETEWLGIVAQRQP